MVVEEQYVNPQEYLKCVETNPLRAIKGVNYPDNDLFTSNDIAWSIGEILKKVKDKDKGVSYQIKIKGWSDAAQNFVLIDENTTKKDYRKEL